MKKIITATLLLLCVALMMSFAGCSVNEDSYNLVFGKDSKSLIPSIGNSAYEAKALYPEEDQEDTAEANGGDNAEETKASGSSTTASDDYVDPTEGFDCADE